ncbi:MAG: 50S ribosomal protein L11 methyltransferase [Hyphomonadaceae bacterium]
MQLLTTVGPLPDIKAAAAAFDGLDPSPADAVSWFEEEPSRFRLEIYVSTDQDEDSARAVIAHVAPALHVHAHAIDDADWVAMALDGLPPVRAGRFFVAGAHALAHAAPGPKRVWIEASEAFGTGHHGTTKGCLLALEHVLRRRRVRRVLDLGAGSGVLAMAAAMTGARALGVELDPRPAAIARVNVANNHLGARVAIRTGDAGIAALEFGPVHDVAFANILMRPLIRLAPMISRAVTPRGALILSGLLNAQAPLVLAAYARFFTLERRIRLEGWSTLLLRRRAAAP